MRFLIRDVNIFHLQKNTKPPSHSLVLFEELEFAISPKTSHEKLYLCIGLNDSIKTQTPGCSAEQQYIGQSV